VTVIRVGDYWKSKDREQGTKLRKALLKSSGVVYMYIEVADFEVIFIRVEHTEKGFKSRCIQVRMNR
jgi:hypothetical protein